MPAPSRGEILRKAAALIDARADAIGRDLTREEGKTLAESIGETQNAARILRYYAAQALDPDGETYPSHRADTFLFTRREALGVVTVITPWNFPIAIAAWKIAPALAARIACAAASAFAIDTCATTSAGCVGLISLPRRSPSCHSPAMYEERFGGLPVAVVITAMLLRSGGARGAARPRSAGSGRGR
jgi:hypothetical protein